MAEAISTTSTSSTPARSGAFTAPRANHNPKINVPIPASIHSLHEVARDPGVKHAAILDAQRDIRRHAPTQNVLIRHLTEALRLRVGVEVHSRGRILPIRRLTAV